MLMVSVLEENMSFIFILAFSMMLMEEKLVDISGKLR